MRLCNYKCILHIFLPRGIEYLIFVRVPKEYEEIEASVDDEDHEDHQDRQAQLMWESFYMNIRERFLAFNIQQTKY